MHGTKPKDSVSDSPSALAIQHERELTELRTNHTAIVREMNGLQTWMQKHERNLELFMDEVRGMFSRNQQRNPTLYVGLASVVLVMITMASGLTIFTINALNGPMRTQLEDGLSRTTAIENRERVAFEMLIRHDERQKLGRKK